MTLLGLIADTHIVPEDRPTPGNPEFFRFPTSSAGTRLPGNVLEALRGVDVILHAGDVYTAGVLDQLQTVAPVICARGNGDTGIAADPRVKATQFLELSGVRIGAIHSTIDLGAGQDLFDKFRERFFQRSLDVLVVGDSHVPLISEQWGLLLVNPGSATMPYGLTNLRGTVAILRIGAGKAVAEVVQLD